MLAPTSNKLAIPLFNGTNYNVWAPLVKIALSEKRISHVLDGPPTPTPTTPEEIASDTPEKQAERKLEKTDRIQTWGIMQRLMTSELRQLNAEPDEAYALWTILKDKYGRQRVDKKYLWMKFYALEFTMGSTIAAHISRINDVADQLAAVGQAVTEEAKSIMLLNRLPPQFEWISKSISTDQAITYEQACHKLLHEEMEINRVPAKEQQLTEVVSVVTGKPESYDFDNDECFRCKGFGHMSKDCATPRDYLQNRAIARAACGHTRAPNDFNRGPRGRDARRGRGGQPVPRQRWDDRRENQGRRRTFERGGGREQSQPYPPQPMPRREVRLDGEPVTYAVHGNEQEFISINVVREDAPARRASWGDQIIGQVGQCE